MFVLLLACNILLIFHILRVSVGMLNVTTSERLSLVTFSKGIPSPHHIILNPLMRFFISPKELLQPDSILYIFYCMLLSFECNL